ncbi:hypothetical protein [Subtercola endophyticus]|uniref:hypothetical protein n=1 Tax=Subtercola endophyticus TaxID=2895559 RepID=UPI001E523C36|nr:hypothetical protein [Subtercola endophyticus]UFS59868.1 hypothetical protein LQ955_03475 [Subtercola endophyticus]
MKVKILIAAGFGVGYLAGSANGRRRIAELTSKASEVLNDPKLKKTVKDTASKVREGAEEAASKLREGAEDGYKKATS